MQLEGLILSLIINTNEDRDVVTVDVFGSYMLANVQDHILIQPTGKTVEVMCKLNTKYKSIVVIEIFKRVLYLKLKKLLYSCM